MQNWLHVTQLLYPWLLDIKKSRLGQNTLKLCGSLLLDTDVIIIILSIVSERETLKNDFIPFPLERMTSGAAVSEIEKEEHTHTE